MRTFAGALVLILGLALPAAAQRSSPDQFLITPGVGVGPLKFAIRIDEAAAVLGTPKATKTYNGGYTKYDWYENDFLRSSTSKGAHGLAAVASDTGEIVRIIAHYDPRYGTANGLHTGVTEAQVKAVMGEPMWVEKIGTIAHMLVYLPGIEFVVVDDPHFEGYRTVAEIAVTR